MVYLPWGVETPWDVTASERLFFYLFFVKWTALTSEVREGGGGIEWAR
jgi:hypothetical protein